MKKYGMLRMISMILALVMLVNLYPVHAFAVSDTERTPEVPEE